MSITEILPGRLYQGDAASVPEVVSAGVDVVVNVSEALDAVAAAPLGGPMYIRWPVPDGDEVPQQDMLRGLADFIARLIMADRKVYVHCGAGINRSNLLTGLVLVALGDNGQEALDKLIRLRGPARQTLANTAFRQWLNAQRV